MKTFKIISTLLTTILLVSCGNNNSKTINDLTIICPTGAPSVAFYQYANNSKFETNSDSNNIPSFMVGKNAKDIVILDTVSAISTINNGVQYQLGATITFGNFWICATGNDENKTMDKGDKIILFKRYGLPDVMFHYLFNDTFDETIEYVASAQVAAQCLTKGKNLNGDSVDYVFLAEPAVSSVLNNPSAPTYGKASKYLDIQEEFSKTSKALFIQASLLINKNIEHNIGEEFLLKLEKDILEGLKNPQLVKDKINSSKISGYYGMTGEVAYNAISNGNTLNLNFKRSFQIKSDIDTFISLFNMEETDDKIYFK